MMKIAIMMKQLLSRGNCKDLSIAVTQGMCYRGILASKNRMEFRTIGLCVCKADGISALPQCQKTLLVDDDSASSYLESTDSDIFTSNEAILCSNNYIARQKSQKEISMIVYELIGFYKPATSSAVDIRYKENYTSSVKKSDLGSIPLSFKWEAFIKSFLEDGKPNIIFVKGSPGNVIFLT